MTRATGPNHFHGKEGMGRAGGEARPVSMKLEKLAKAKDQRVRELYDRLVEGVRAVLDRADWKAYLDMLARFHNYSPANVALILAQYPHATRVAGIKTWNSLGRRVRPGERGIKIFAPTIRKVTVRVEEVDPETGETRVVEREEERLVGFHVTHVWDVSQTEGRPLPEPEFRHWVCEGSEKKARELYYRLLAASPVPVREGCILRPGVLGVYNSNLQEIHLSCKLGDMPWPNGVRTLLHELAHALAHRLGVDSIKHILFTPDGYARGEAIAEGAAYVAARLMGLDTFGMSTEYIAWYVRDAERLLVWAEAVQRVANALVELVELTENKEGSRAA